MPMYPETPRGAPAEVVGGRDVGQEAESLRVAQVLARVEQPIRLDDERRLAVRLPNRHEPGNALPALAHEATLRSSYAGGIPAWIASCSRMMPSISCSGRGGQPGTYMSTATILSTDWTIA